MSAHLREELHPRLGDVPGRHDYVLRRPEGDPFTDESMELAWVARKPD